MLRLVLEDRRVDECLERCIGLEKQLLEVTLKLERQELWISKLEETKANTRTRKPDAG